MIVITAVVVGMVVVGIATVVIVAAIAAAIVVAIAIVVIAINVIAMSALYLLLFCTAFHLKIATTALEYSIVGVTMRWMVAKSSLIYSVGIMKI